MTQNQSPGHLAALTIDPTNSLTSIACPSTTFCVAVDDGANALQGDPSTGGGWTLAPIRGANPLNGVSCSSLSRCVAVGAIGDAYDRPWRRHDGFVRQGNGNREPPSGAQLQAQRAPGAAKIHTITVLSPNGLQFSSLGHRSLDGIVVTARAERVTFGTSVSHGKLTITLATPKRTVQIQISEPAITVTGNTRERSQSRDDQDVPGVPHSDEYGSLADAHSVERRDHQIGSSGAMQAERYSRSSTSFVAGSSHASSARSHGTIVVGTASGSKRPSANNSSTTGSRRRESALDK